MNDFGGITVKVRSVQSPQAVTMSNLKLLCRCYQLGVLNLGFTWCVAFQINPWDGHTDHLMPGSVRGSRWK